MRSSPHFFQPLFTLYLSVVLPPRISLPSCKRLMKTFYVVLHCSPIVVPFKLKLPQWLQMRIVTVNQCQRARSPVCYMSSCSLTTSNTRLYREPWSYMFLVMIAPSFISLGRPHCFVSSQYMTSSWSALIGASSGILLTPLPLLLFSKT